MITSENASGPTWATPSNTNPPDVEPEGWESNLTEAPWRLIGFNESGSWDSAGKSRLISTNDRLQEQINKLKQVR